MSPEISYTRVRFCYHYLSPGDEEDDPSWQPISSIDLALLCHTFTSLKITRRNLSLKATKNCLFRINAIINGILPLIV